MPYLDAEVGIGVLVVKFSPLIREVEFDKDLLVHPGRGRDVELPLCVALEGGVGVVLFNKCDDELGLVFESFDVEVHLGADHVFGAPVVGGVVAVGVVRWAFVAACDDHPFASFLLDVVEQVDEGGVDKLLAIAKGEAVAPAPLAVAVVEGLFAIAVVDDNGVEGVAFAAEKFFGDAGVAADVLLFPRVGVARLGAGRVGGEEVLVVVAHQVGAGDYLV